MRSLVTGATGFIGRKLVNLLDNSVVLSRDSLAAERRFHGKDIEVFPWDPQIESPPLAALDGIEVVYHLAGEPVGEGRWTAAKKKRIYESRILGTRNLIESLNRLERKPTTLVSTSAIGYYGYQGEEEFDEMAGPGNDFLAEVCRDWEKESQQAKELGIRVVNPRIGVVLGLGGGALGKMTTPFRLGLGSPLGSGNQWTSWIHIDDVVYLLKYLAEDSQISGPVNAVSPYPVTNREFTKKLARSLNRPAWMPAVPAFMLKILIGEFSEILLCSQKISPRAAIDAGYSFHYPKIEDALENLFKS